MTAEDMFNQFWYINCSYADSCCHANAKKIFEHFTDTEMMLKILKDRGVIDSWYYNGTYHMGNELPK